MFSSSPGAETLLEAIPDFLDWNKALLWIEEGQKVLQPSLMMTENNIFELSWSDIALPSTSSFGFYPLENWRKFVLAVYFADLVSYKNPIEQVNFDRLLFVMHAFPQGFRVWWIQVSDLWLPVGYSAWYPMLESAFELFKRNPERIKDRMVVPAPSIEKSPYLYLFNFSAMPSLKGSLLTKQLIKHFIQEIQNFGYSGLACITVSEDGARIAKRLGMDHTGNFNLAGSIEGVYLYHHA